MAAKLPSIDADLSAEQEWFDAVRATREAKRVRRSTSFTTGASSKDRHALSKASRSDATLGLPEDEVAFLRVDQEDGSVFYIGRNSILDDAGDPLAYSWRAPVSLRLRGATHTDTRGVLRHRQYQTRPVNEIDRFEDIFFAELAGRVAGLPDDEPSLLRSDPYLQESLERHRSPQMEDIVRTIQAAQADIISAPAEQLLVVQGGPGTGKTAVALHRVAALLFNELRDREHDEVLVVGPNMTFLRYIARVLPDLGEDRVVHRDIDRLMEGNVTVSVKERPEAARLKGSEDMCEVISRGLEDRIKVPQEDATFTFDGFSWRVTVSPEAVSALLDEIDVLPYSAGRHSMRSALENLLLREAKRLDRVAARTANLRPRAAEIEAYLERMWPQLSPQAFLRDLFGSLERLVSAASGTLDVEALQLLRRQPAPRLSEQLWSKEDLPLLDHVTFKITGEAGNYAHVVIDEAQDLSPMQLMALRRRSRTGAMTVVGDIAQSTGPWARDSWDDLTRHLRSPLPVNVEQLRYGYRVPEAVMELAARLLPSAAPGVKAPTVVTGVTQTPRWIEGEDEQQIVEKVVGAVQHHSAKGLFVGIICPDECRGNLSQALDAAEINWSDADKGELTTAINLVSPHGAKGLEFDAVVVVDPQSIVDGGPHGVRMLYVALTRTTRALDIVFSPARVPSVLRPGGLPAASAPGEARWQSAAASAPAAPDRATVGASTPHLTPHVGAAVPGRTTSARNAVITAASHHVLEMLSDVAPRHLWHQILTEALSSATEDELEARE